MFTLHEAHDDPSADDVTRTRHAGPRRPSDRDDGSADVPATKDLGVVRASLGGDLSHTHVVEHLFGLARGMTDVPRRSARRPRSLTTEQLGRENTVLAAQPARVKAWVLWEAGVEELVLCAGHR